MCGCMRRGQPQSALMAYAIRQEPQVHTGGPQNQDNRSRWEKNPQLRAGMEPRSIVERLDEVGAPVRALQYGAALGVNLQFPIRTTPDLHHPLPRTNVNAINIGPAGDPCLGNRPRDCDDPVEPDGRRGAGTSAFGRLDPAPVLLQLEQDPRRSHDEKRKCRGNRAPPMQLAPKPPPSRVRWTPLSMSDSSRRRH